MADFLLCQASILILVIFSLGSCDINCLSCQNAKVAKDCLFNNVTCPDGQMCFLDRTLDDLQQIVYNAGCRSPEVCQVIHSTGRDLSSCAECCNDDGDVPCNQRLCGLTNATSVKKLRCLACDGLVQKLSDCTTYTVCNESQWCSAGVYIVSGKLKYSYRCRDISQCNKNTSSLQSSNGDGIVVCQRCCQEDECNKLDCYELARIWDFMTGAACSAGNAYPTEATGTTRKTSTTTLVTTPTSVETSTTTITTTTGQTRDTTSPPTSNSSTI